MINKKPLLGDTRQFGNQIQVYTERGWIICDNSNEVQEELNKIRSLKNESINTSGS